MTAQFLVAASLVCSLALRAPSLAQYSVRRQRAAACMLPLDLRFRSPRAVSRTCLDCTGRASHTTRRARQHLRRAMRGCERCSMTSVPLAWCLRSILCLHPVWVRAFGCRRRWPESRDGRATAPRQRRDSSLQVRERICPKPSFSYERFDNILQRITTYHNVLQRITTYHYVS